MSELKTLFELFKEKPDGIYEAQSEACRVRYNRVSSSFRYTKSGNIFFIEDPRCFEKIWRFYEEPKEEIETIEMPARMEVEILAKENTLLKQKLKGALIRKKWPEEKPKKSGELYAINPTGSPSDVICAYHGSNLWDINELDITDKEFYFYEPYEEECVDICTCPDCYKQMTLDK